MAATTRDVNIQQAAEQRTELSPRRGFASLGYEPTKVIEPREGATATPVISTPFIFCRRFAALQM